MARFLLGDIFAWFYRRGDGGDREANGSDSDGWVCRSSGMSFGGAHLRRRSGSDSLVDGDGVPLCVSRSLASTSCRRAWSASSSAVWVETLFFLREMSSDTTATQDHTLLSYLCSTAC